MPQHAAVVGATGQIGLASVRSLTDHGWTVTAIHRGNSPEPAEWADRGVRVVHADRADDDALRAALGAGVDVLVDTVAYGADHGRQLNALVPLARSLVVISTAGVYADDAGRVFPGDRDPLTVPDFGGPIPESQPTVEPGDDSYPTRKVALERVLLDESPVPVTILRPCAILGVGSVAPREWWPLMRALQGRPAIPLAFDGGGAFHTSSSANIAEQVRLAAEQPGMRVLNSGDPEVYDAATLVRMVCATTDHQPEIVTFPGWPAEDADEAGLSPWSIPGRLVVDMTASARELGYQPVTSYDEAMIETCQWLREITAGKEWREVLPSMARMYGASFDDFAAEDRLLGKLR